MSKIKNICGSYPDGFEKKDLDSNPNYLFINDPNYDGVTVYDSEGNSVFMNSFEECEHYVSGGWDYNSSISREIFFQNSIGILLIVALLSSFLFKKYVSVKSF